MPEITTAKYTEPGTARGFPRVLKLALVLLIAVLVVGAVIVWGIDARIKTAAAVKQETLDLATPTVGVAHPKMGALQNEVGAAGQHPGLHRLADFRTRQRIPQEMVRRYGSACEGRPDSGRNRCARVGSTGSSGPVGRGTGQSRVGSDARQFGTGQGERGARARHRPALE